VKRAADVSIWIHKPHEKISSDLRPDRAFFLLTGQYMDRFHEHLNHADGPRMLYRTRHIFILMSGLLHLGIGSYFFGRAPGGRRALQILGSALISIAPILTIELNRSCKVSTPQSRNAG
jgi:hypothetical protein